MQAKFAVIIGDEELQKGIVTLKDMKEETQKEVKQEELTAEIRGHDKTISQRRLDQIEQRH